MKRTALIILSLLTVLSLTACTDDRSDNNNIKTDSGMAELQELQEEQNNKDNEIQKEKVLRTLAVTGNGKTINLPCKVSDLKTLGLTFKQPGNDDTNEDGTYISHDMTGFGIKALVMSHLCRALFLKTKNVMKTFPETIMPQSNSGCLMMKCQKHTQ